MNETILFLPGIACNSTIWNDLTFKGIKINWPRNELPTFNELDTISNWTLKKVENAEVIIGHSMGGLIALYLAQTKKINPNKIIIIESFLSPPSPFFHNLVHKTCDKQVENKIKKMLRDEKIGWQDSLFDQLINSPFDFKLPISSSIEIHAIYGDRGQNDKSEIIRNLNKTIIDNDKIHLVSNACHFPMIENPTNTNTLLKQIIK